jgi:hypothetical protein
MHLFSSLKQGALRQNTSLALAALLLAGCEMPQRAGPSSTTAVEYRLPVLTPVDVGKQDQEKDGIKISVAPYSYAPKQQFHREFRRIPAILLVDNQYPAEMRETPSIEVSPSDVRLRVKIYNHFERVLRLAGAVVSFQVAGKSAVVPRAKYNDFLEGIILPRQEGEYEIAGPELSDLPDNATIGLFLFDIVTETDAAGNPTKRSNFEFYYTLSQEAKTENVSPRVQRVTLNKGEAALLYQREQGSGRWVSVPTLDRIVAAQENR